MRSRCHFLSYSIAILVLIVSPAAWGQPKLANSNDPGIRVAYSIAPAIEAQSFDVTAILVNIPEDTITFQFPIWAPGAYDVEHFGKYVSGFGATNIENQRLFVDRLDTSTFRIASHRSKWVTITYRIHDAELPEASVWFCASDVDSDYIFANGAAVFGYPKGYKDIPYYVSFTVLKGWDIELGLDRPHQFTYPDKQVWYMEAFIAHDYDELIDMPFQIGKPGKRGNMETAEFDVAGKHHMVTLTTLGTNQHVDIKELADSTARIVKAVSDFFGDMPYDHYLFQHYIADGVSRKFDDAYGALEHRNSSTYLSPAQMAGSGYTREMITEIAHEYFHAWSPKRIHVKQLGPFDYQNPPNTRSLWFAEGLTEYYSRIIPVRAGILSRNDFLDEFSEDLASLYKQHARLPVTQVSLDISRLPEEESTPALYSKGPVIGLLLDAAIRSETKNGKSLDDAMRYFNRAYGRTGKTFGDDDIIPIIDSITGVDLRGFYDRYINGTEPLPIDEYLPKIGMKFEQSTVTRRTMGAEMERVDTGFRIVSIQPHGSAEAMGLRANDIIIALEVSHTNLPLSVIPAGYELNLANIENTESLTVLRDGAALKVPALFREGPVMVRLLAVDPKAGPQAAAIRRSMFGF